MVGKYNKKMSKISYNEHMRCDNLVEMFEKIGGYKKFMVCKSCGVRLEIEHTGQKLCKQCGYREGRKR